MVNKDMGQSWAETYFYSKLHGKVKKFSLQFAEETFKYLHPSEA